MTHPALKSPAYVAVTLITLALAVGANLVVFTLVNAIWLRSRPVHQPDRVVVVSNLSDSPDGPGRIIDLLALDHLDRLREQPVFEGVAGQVGSGGIMGDLRPRVVFKEVGREVEALGVTIDYFPVLGVPVRGRGFTPDDDRLGAPPVAIVSDRLWHSAFSGDPSVIHSTVRTSRGLIEIAGVAPPGFQGARLGEQVDLWVPRAHIIRLGGLASALDDPTFDASTLPVPFLGLARLRPDVTPSQAEQAIAGVLGLQSRVVVRPLADVYGSSSLPTMVLNEGPVLRLVAVTASLVLLAGCATLAALVLVHYERRRRELAIRLAFGSSRRRLAASLTGELLLLALAGTGCALLVAAWVLASLPSLSLPGGVQLDRLGLRIDLATAAVAVGISVVSMLAAGLLPLVRFTHPALAASLTASSQTAAPNLLRFRRFLVATHAAATLVVIVGAGLFLQTLAYAFQRAPGFDVDRTLFVAVQPGVAEFLDPTEGPDQPGHGARKRAAYSRLLEELSALPGVGTVALGYTPIRPDAIQASPVVFIVDEVQHSRKVGYVSGGAGYAAALGLPILSGRDLAASDAGTGAVLMTQSLAVSLWPAMSAVGRQFSSNPGRRGAQEVVGIVPDFVIGSLRSGVRGGVVSMRSLEESVHTIPFGVAISTSGQSAGLVPAATQVTSRLFPLASRLTVEPAREIVARDFGRERLGAWFLSGFGLVAFALGLSGVFGLVAYLAESRRRELGIRMAVGATPGALMRVAIGTGLSSVAAGTIAGLVVAALAVRTVETFLHGVSRLDPLTYAGAGALMLVGALAAGFLASLRIRRVSPIDVLRAE